MSSLPIQARVPRARATIPPLLGGEVARSNWFNLVDTEPYEAISTSRAIAFASRICRGVRQCARRMSGLATTAAMHWARLVATLRRLRLYRNSIPRGASATELVAIE